MSKIIKYEKDAQTSIIKGIDAVANIVKTTIGPKGKNVLIRNQISTPIITNDGVTIAKAIQLKDNIEDAGAALIISAANKTNIKAGDGTTTTTILAQEMIHQYYDKVTPDINPVQVQNEMIKASQEISEKLKKLAIAVNSNADVEKVATISSGDPITGKLIADAFNLAGDYGSVIVENSKSGDNNLIAIEGMKFSNGSVTPYLFTDRINRKSEVIDCSILVVKDKIDNVTELFPILDLCVKEGRKLLILCDDIEMEPLNVVLVNKTHLNVNIVRLPGFGELRQNLIEDICLATGAHLISRDDGKTLREFTPEDFGIAKGVIITDEDTIIKFKDMSLTGIDLKAIREQRCEELKGIMNSLTEESQKEQYKRRISNLISGIATIEIGGNSDVEIEDKKLRIEDALNSVQAAKEEGIVAGGGYSLLSILKEKLAEDSMTFGEKIVYNSLKAVTHQIAQNAGQDGNSVVDRCLKENLGYNALTNNYENLIETGVINSAKVDRFAVLNSASIAATIITMGGVIIEENEPEHNVLQLQAPLTGNML